MYMYDYYDTAHLLGLDSKICGYRFGLAIEQEMLTGKNSSRCGRRTFLFRGA
jgi:hypothetical protein